MSDEFEYRIDYRWQGPHGYLEGVVYQGGTLESCLDRLRAKPGGVLQVRRVGPWRDLQHDDPHRCPKCNADRDSGISCGTPPCGFHIYPEGLKIG